MMPVEISPPCIQWVQVFYARYAAAEIDALLELIGPRFQWHEPAGSPFAGVYRGRTALLEGLLMPAAERFEMRPRVRHVSATDARVLVHGATRATERATGRQLRFDFSTAFRFDGHTPVRADHAFDTDALRVAGGK